MRAAAYLRVSTDRQSAASPDDQLRKCREFAGRQGWHLLDEHTYRDDSISGTGTDRPALSRLLKAAESTPRPFDVLLLDDSSRLSRNLGESARILDRLGFVGVRVVAVSQGIDTEHEQSDVLVTVHGLVDSLYVKELAKKTHRGLEGRAIRGLHTGGRCFGYDTVDADGGKVLRVVESEAEVVRRIFSMSASGMSLKGIAKGLNGERVSAPRSRKGRASAGWCPTAIRAMLHNERYVGRVVWNRTRFVKVPGTNRRVSRPRPKSEWRLAEVESLRIVPQELWDQAHERLAWVKDKYGQGSRPGLLVRSASSPYLFSGLLTCSECGGSISLVRGTRRGHQAQYGCSRSFQRGTCDNDLLERRDRLEDRLLAGLQESVLQPEAVDYALTRFQQQLQARLGEMSSELTAARERKRELEGELRRLVAAVAEGGHSAFLLDAISEREKELRDLTERLLGTDPGSVQASLDEMREFVVSRLGSIREVLYSRSEQARAELARHVGSITLHPVEKDGKRYYEARGRWGLLLQGSSGNLRVVAGARKAPIIPAVDFKIPILAAA